MLKDMFPRISRNLFAFAVVFIGSTSGFGSIEISESFVVEEPTEAAQPDIRQLKPAEWVEREIDPKSIHLYSIELNEGDALEIELARLDVALRASIWGPGITAFAGPTSEHPTVAKDVYYATLTNAVTTERLIGVAEKTGIYHLRIQTEAKGNYKFRGVPRPATAVDRKYAEIARLMFEVRTSGLGLRSTASVIGHYDKQIDILREIGDLPRVGLVLRYRGSGESALGQFAKSIATLREAGDHFKKLGLFQDAIHASPYRSFEAIGDFQSAIEYLQTEIDLSRQINNKQSEAGALLNLGVIYHRLADEAKARYYYEQSLIVVRSIDPRSVDSWGIEMTLYTNFGNLARGMNGGEVPIEFFPARTREDFESALPFLFKAVEICEKNNFPFIQFNYRQIANTYAELGRYDEAIEYFERSIRLNTERNDSRVAAIARKELARVFIRQGKKAEGAALLEAVIPILRVSSNELHDIASWLHIADRSDRAKELLEESLEMVRQRRMLPVEATVLHKFATIERDLGNFENARKHITEAINIADSLRNRITSDEIRSVYFSAVRKYYDFYIDLLMQAHKSQPEKHFDRSALEVTEKARSRNLVDLLKLSGVDIRQGVDPDLLTRERLLKSQLTEKAARQNRLRLTRHTSEEADKADRDVAEVSEALTRTEAEIRKKSPGYAAVTQPSNISVKRIQELLDPGTVLLEYSLGERKSYLWVISKDQIHSFDLPDRAEIDKQARSVYGTITARNKARSVQASGMGSATSTEEGFSAAALVLAETLLAPAVPYIRNKRVVVVPDGTLNYVPFATLPFPSNSKGGSGASSLLVQSHELVTLPSALTLDRLRDEKLSRVPPPKIMAVFADPVFSSGDARISSLGNRAAGPKHSRKVSEAVALRDLDLAAASTGYSGGLPRLPFSRREADSIVGQLPKELAAKHVGFQATKKGVFDLGLDQYRIVHFATHGLLDSKHPALSGMVLSLLDQNGSEIDGFLRLQDIYNLKLNADLVVLSGCETALGKEIRAEGLIGLTRGFMYAGAPRVVASLWKVDDAATAHLMSVFYRKMLVEDMRPAAALRAAQLEMMKQPRWRSPYYWAPFVLQGEWK